MLSIPNHQGTANHIKLVRKAIIKKQKITSVVLKHVKKLEACALLVGIENGIPAMNKPHLDCDIDIVSQVGTFL